ncbi:recombinase RecA [Vibrio owensii]|uniref:recombinase RecA n=1 Tax=Vibrio owensii TaxID=696485 RepID=UPI0018F1EFFD|nr:recombinase RecA [Vibrio owensii]
MKRQNQKVSAVVQQALKQVQAAKLGVPTTSIKALSSGSLSIDESLLTNGFAEGRIHEISGPPTSGKTTITLAAIACAQQCGKVAAYFDADRTFDPNYAKSLGVDLESLILIEPEFGEAAIDAICILLKSKAVDLMVVDSAAALCPKAELIYDMNTPLTGVASRMMSTGLRRINALLKDSTATIIFTNQLRYKLSNFMDPQLDSPCGLSLKFYCTTRVRLDEPKVLIRNQTVSGIITKFRVIKNKLARPFEEGCTQIVYGRGINHLYETIETGRHKKKIEVKDGVYYFGEVKLDKGISKSMLYLKSNPEIYQNARQSIFPSRATP